MPELSDRAKKLLVFVQKDRSDSFSKFALALELWKLGFEAPKVEALFKDILTNEPTYVGLYYHYGAWLEEQDRASEAVSIYKKGLDVARQQRDTHAEAELMNAKTNAELNS